MYLMDVKYQNGIDAQYCIVRNGLNIDATDREALTWLACVSEFQDHFTDSSFIIIKGRVFIKTDEWLIRLFLQTIITTNVLNFFIATNNTSVHCCYK